MQPESPAQLGGKIYEMMDIALTGKWGVTPGFKFQQPISNTQNLETAEAEIVEPTTAGSQK